MKNIIICLFFSTMTLLSHAHATELEKTQSYVGIGAALEKLSDGSVRIIGLIPNAPAERNGLKIDDFIITVQPAPSSQTVDIASISLADAVALIRGPIGVPVTLLIRNKSGEYSISIIREKFEVEGQE